MVWEEAKSVLRKTLPENIFDLWIEPLKCVQNTNDQLELSCPDPYYRAHLAQHHLEQIRETVHDIDGGRCQVLLSASGRKSLPPAAPGNQLRLPHVPEGGSSVRSLHPRYTFDSFMVGESNCLAQSACRAVVNGDDSIGPCLYINSSTGLGKSHLTHAVAHRILATSPMTRLHYLTAQQFSGEMVREIKGNTMDRFKRKYHECCDILLVEDIHALTGKKKTQEELNELLDSLIKGGKRVVFTAKSAPRELLGIDNDLRSRMTAGLVTRIDAPDISTRRRIIQHKAALHGLDLAEEHCDYIAQHIQGDVRQIESALVAIRAQSALCQGDLKMECIRETVESIVGVPQILTTAMIGEFVGGQFKVGVQEMQSRSRKQAVVFPRQVAMYLSRQHTQESLADIGRAFNRDHATVLHSIKVVTERSLRDHSVSAQIDLLNKKMERM
ncbi:MAG: chromosomal replication initiator protein DnaA [Desulfobulbaceae bacterium]|uniref:Chromosomal replication initiator protein DnaA n=1 Tax=Candidatus Desulfatifera sulfidica TaxID=2841691 RepID=A0A8J6T9J0_9BACT|nr:chromosomal replication initiator protein DnaA [Candidatus Desulfatifera sulfidica]